MIIDHEKITQQPENIHNHTDDLNASQILNDPNGMNDPMQHTLDPESKITLGNLSPERLSPNIFLGLNMDGIDDRNNISVEWTNYMENTPTISIQSQHPHELTMSLPMTSMPIVCQNQYTRPNLLNATSAIGATGVSNATNVIDINNYFNLDTATSPYDEIKFLGVDHFNNMDSFKEDCILNMDQSIFLDAKSIGESSVTLVEPSKEPEICETFVLRDSMEKSIPLVDLGKPIININLEHISMPDAQHSTHLELQPN